MLIIDFNHTNFALWLASYSDDDYLKFQGNEVARLTDGDGKFGMNKALVSSIVCNISIFIKFRSMNIRNNRKGV